MTIETQLHNARIVSSVAATIISLACGTNYVYSAWAPQFADRLHLSATESNLIGLFGNLGMYLMGAPVGVLIDARGPRPAVIIGSILLGVGYWPLHNAYNVGQGSVPWMCFFSFLSGLGGCTAFAAAIKTSALNWPHHRGTATAIPLAAFGLSAFFFSLIGSVAFPGDPGRFLELLAAGTFGMTFVGFFFLRIYPHSHVHHSHYEPVHQADGDMSASRELRRTTSRESKSARMATAEPGMSPNDTAASTGGSPPRPAGEPAYGTSGRPFDVEAGAANAARGSPDEASGADDVDETSSLMSRSSTASSMPGDVLVQSTVDLDRSHRVDIRGWALMRNAEFWQLFCIMGILAGVGLMTINNIGNDSTALWRKWDGSITDKELVLRQQMHVSILSIGSCAGRLSSGVGSDYLVKRLSASRVWCLVIAAGIFSVAQMLALTVVNPHLLGLVSGLSGLGYGFLFGVFPSIVAESFGIHGLSQNWGFMTLSPVLSSNVFNLFYGRVLDSHSVVEPDGSRACEDGIACYKEAYWATLFACALGSVVTLFVIWFQRRDKDRLEKERVVRSDD